MGTFQHHAIVVTCWEDAAKEAHAKAVALGMSVSPIVRSPVNAFDSFCIFPDGSKEGWNASDEGDQRREQWTTWAKSIEYKWKLDWVEVSYGEYGQCIEPHPDND